MVTAAMKLKDTCSLEKSYDSILKIRDITLPTKIHLVKAMAFPVVMYGCESWTIKKAEGKYWCFWTVVLEKTFEAITNSGSLPKLMSIELVMPSIHLILCHPLVLLLPISPSIRGFSSESTLCMRWPNYWRHNTILILLYNITVWFLYTLLSEYKQV